MPETNKMTKSKVPDKKWICTQCGGDAYIAWGNDTKKDQNYFGAIIKPGERLCLVCGKKRGVNFSFHKGSK